MLALIPTVEVARLWLEEQKYQIPAGSDGAEIAAQSFASSLNLDAKPLRDVMHRLYADSWLPGAKDATAQLGDAPNPETPIAQAASRVSWFQWKAGEPPDVADLLDTGFERFLEEQNMTLRGINSTTEHEIGLALERGLAEGQPVKVIAGEIDKVLGDPKRALLIARTETNRAMTEASLETYRQNGIGEWDLLTAVDPCPICLGIRAGNPHSVADVAQKPPIHPACRCGCAPVINPGGRV